MKIEIKARFSTQVLFTAEIETYEGESSRVRLGKAVKVAVNVGAYLGGADLGGAYLRDADLGGADLVGASLRGAYLGGAYLRGAYLGDADLRDADLGGADLGGADLGGAYLRGAYLGDADLGGANLNGVCGLNDWIKCIQVEDWPISYTSEVMQIGCHRHSFDAWRNFSDAEIRAMGGMRALNFWRKWKAWVFQTIEMAPAKPTGAPQQALAVDPSQAHNQVQMEARQ
ncbi:pentapeptide repeat-containing protein [Paracoccus denitrificans]|uniref:pentapeptide repeat-containing protein n=1 Tax=Paracoccus denitrificans TaxID=266 RepID=UPI001E4CC6D0|nr:pentapeptide repeat-containing protein [Paracoccus denitrificans]UFS66925.1 pentapeptide repeat-containing protein [Paracoccus denitrificans]